jgi:hypothetical protein
MGDAVWIFGGPAPLGFLRENPQHPATRGLPVRVELPRWRCCSRVTYTNWSEHQTGVELDAIVSKLRRFAAAKKRD